MSGSVAEFDDVEFGDLHPSGTISPELSSSHKCLKLTLILFNILFLIFGSVLCAVGNYALNNDATALSGSNLPNGLIACGVFILLLSFLGCFSSWKESSFLLKVYFTIISLITLILFAVGIAVYTLRNDSKTLLTEGWSNSPPVVKGTVQDAFKCCGFTQYNDNPVNPATNLTIPECPPRSLTLSRPCYPLLSDAFEQNLTTAGACGIGFAIIMFIALLFVGFLMNGINKKKQLEARKDFHRRVREAKEPEDVSQIIAARTMGRDFNVNSLAAMNININGGNEDQDVERSSSGTGATGAAAGEGSKYEIPLSDEEIEMTIGTGKKGNKSKAKSRARAESEETHDPFADVEDDDDNEEFTAAAAVVTKKKGGSAKSENSSSDVEEKSKDKKKEKGKKKKSSSGKKSSTNNEEDEEETDSFA